ncbi:PREDICTED: uncharacterized protein LOC102870673 [Elephantulus edwardii]|uniref:uncharacterized protein LOC102870673 n=1 Tax=Elephantulus edwardii TaxID=28737 RepID=UPI0003F07084|nr:PREDICTED: uncharacterized protein LOC102870673 [Elephantulus edwardii]
MLDAQVESKKRHGSLHTVCSDGLPSKVSGTLGSRHATLLKQLLTKPFRVLRGALQVHLLIKGSPASQAAPLPVSQVASFPASPSTQLPESALREADMGASQSGSSEARLPVPHTLRTSAWCLGNTSYPIFRSGLLTRGFSSAGRHHGVGREAEVSLGRQETRMAEKKEKRLTTDEQVRPEGHSDLRPGHSGQPPSYPAACVDITGMWLRGPVVNQRPELNASPGKGEVGPQVPSTATNDVCSHQCRAKPPTLSVATSTKYNHECCVQPPMLSEATKTEYGHQYPVRQPMSSMATSTECGHHTKYNHQCCVQPPTLRDAINAEHGHQHTVRPPMPSMATSAECDSDPEHG